MSINVDQKLRKYARLKKRKAPFLKIWQVVGEFINQLKQDFTAQVPQGEMLNTEVFDSTAIDARSKATGVMVGMLWPSAKVMEIVAPKGLKETAVTKAYFEKVNENIRADLDDPKAGLSVAYEEFMGEQLDFGTSALAAFEGRDSTLSVECWGVDDSTIGEGYGGLITTTYREICWPLERVVETYGEESLSPKLRALVKAGKWDEEVKILQIIEPRETVKAGMLDNRNMPIASCHIELDTKHPILETGYQEQPASWVRFYKRKNETYGRSPGMKAVPDILELNVTKEARMLAIEKALDPPLGVFSDSVMGNQAIDTSARAINVVKPSKMRQGNPIFPLMEGNNIREADKSIEELKESVNGHFNIDRLLDFNNSSEMTLGEAQMRFKIRGESNGSIFSRQLLGMTQFLERCVAICYRKGRLGVIEGSVEHRLAMMDGLEPVVIPDEIARLIMSGKEFYAIKYSSPAARILEAEEADGVQRTWQFALGVAEAQPEIMDGLDSDESLDVIAKSFGAPSRIQTSKELREKIREARHKQVEQQAKAQQMEQLAGAAANASKADAA